MAKLKTIGAAFLSASAVFTVCVSANDIASDSGPTSSIEASVEKLSLDGADVRRSQAMLYFAEACMNATKKNGIDAKSVDLLFKALEQDPRSDEVIRNLVPMMIQTNTLKKNIERLQTLASEHPESLELANACAELLDIDGKRPAAMAITKAAVDYAREHGESFKASSALRMAVSRLALMQTATGDKEGALDTLDWALAQPELGDSLQILQAAMSVYFALQAKAETSSPWWTLGLGASESEKLEKQLADVSTRFVSKAMEKEAQVNIAAYQNAFGILKAQKRLPEVRSLLLNILLRKPNDPETLGFLARVCFDMGDYANSCRAWRAALRAGLVPSPQVYTSFAMALRGLGDLKDASNMLEWLLLIEPANRQAALQLALCQFEQGQIALSRNNLSAFNDSYNALYLKALCSERLKLHKQALDELLKSEALLQKDSSISLDDRNYRFLRATFAEKAARPEIVRESIKPLLDENPDDAEALNFLGYILANMNADLDFAEKCIDKALKINPESPAYMDSKAWVLFRKQQLKEAVDWIEKALKASGEPADAVICDHAGDIYAALGDKEAALKFWRKALSLPLDPEMDAEQTKAKIEALEKR